MREIKLNRVPKYLESIAKRYEAEIEVDKINTSHYIYFEKDNKTIFGLVLERRDNGLYLDQLYYKDDFYTLRGKLASIKSLLEQVQIRYSQACVQAEAEEWFHDYEESLA